ncbi:MFS transporter [Clostridium cylindrosporum]|uniref:Multidrug resistance protein 2 n=1 Tax=Clostridium cylindrosporum DSM 605 TaxID=1121307 RepID=A0A0J8G2E5_CLOCY|nr:MFS transporter [Clostridium cylindrosporum]KMT21906.1 multidrug resistance protein 2 [Clostridium cylindrosporum DSM 605]
MQKTIKEQRMELLILLSNIFIVFLGVGLVIPVMPAFMNSMNLSGKTMGYLISAFATAQLIMSPFAGSWVDRYGRKRIIVIGLVVFSISELIFALGTHVSMLYISRCLGGISAAFIMPGVTAYIADITSIENRPKAMGYMSAAISTGFIIGPGISGFVAGYGIRMPFFVASAVGFLAFISSIFFLRETLSKEQIRENSLAVKEGNFISDMKKSLNPVYLVAFIIVFVLAFGLSAYETVFTLFSDHKFGFTPRDIAQIITISAIFGAIVQISMFGKIVNVIGEKRLIQLCLIIGGILAVVSTVISSYIVILIVTCLIFLAFDLLRPALTTFLSKAAQKEQGFVAGMNSTYTSLGNIAGPAMAGVLFDININYPYLLAAVVMVIGLCISVMWKENRLMES